MTRKKSQSRSTGREPGAEQRSIRVSVEAGIGRVLLERRPVNALSFAFYADIATVMNELAARDGVRCLLLGSAIDKVFCAGADVSDFRAAAASPDSGEAREARVLGMLRAVHGFPYPVVAVVDGAAVGAGCVLAAVCDMRVASTRSWFSLPEIDVTRIGGAHHTRRLLPEGVVRRMFFTGERLPAQRAYELGAVDELAEPAQLWPAAERLAATIATKSPIGLRLGKRALNEAEELPLWTGYFLEQQYSHRLSRLDAARLLSGVDEAEGERES